VREDRSLHESFKMGLVFFKKLFTEMQPRIIKPMVGFEVVVLIYSDACWVRRPDGTIDAGLGAVVIFPAKRVVFHGQTPPAILDALQERETQINPIEAVANVATFYSVLHLIRGARVIAFVDNSSAVSSLVSGHSTQMDMQCITTLFHRMLVKEGIKAWFEWIQSALNIADGPSRGQFLGLEPADFAFPPWLSAPLVYSEMVKKWF
jgi:hypothetical protein